MTLILIRPVYTDINGTHNPDPDPADMLDCQFTSTCACSIGGSSYLMIADSFNQQLVTVCLNCTGSGAAPGLAGAVVTSVAPQAIFPITLSYSAYFQELLIGARPTGSVWK